MSKFVATVFQSESVVVFEATVATKLDKQLVRVWAGPLSGPQIAQQSEKTKRHQSGACSDLTAPGFFVAPDGSLQPYNPNWRILFVSVPNQHRRLSLFAQLFLQKKRVFPLPAQIFTLPA